MKILFTFSLLCLLSFSFSGISYAQDDENRQSSGLPRMIGSGGLSGKLTIQGLDASQSKPTFFVVVYLNGAVMDRRQVDDKGFYHVPNFPRLGGVIGIEMNGSEVGRYEIPPSIMGNVRQDLMINAGQIKGATGKPGTISAKSYYQRTSENQKAFDNATTSAKEKKPDNAIKLFKDLVKNDPQDFVAWTELGTLYFRGENFSESEQAYQKALEQKPDFIVALVNLGKLHLAQKQSEKAVSVLTKAVETEAASPDAQHYLGEAYLQIKKGSIAVVHLNEAIKLAPLEKAEIHLRLAALYNAAKLKDKAVAEYKLFLEKVPRHTEKENIEKYIKENSPK